MSEGQDAKIVNEGQPANEPGRANIEGDGMMPLRYRCNTCGADHVIQIPRKRRAVDINVWAQQMGLRIAMHHHEHHADCPAPESGIGTVDTLFPVEGQDAEALAKMDWPTRDEVENHPSRKDH